jgi:serine/threonine protein phosphatase PrpC/uncharacterized OB-fold protein
MTPATWKTNSAMMICPNCGKQNRPAAKFCKHCGADLSSTRATPSTTTAQRATPPQPASPAAPQTAGRLAPLQRGSILSHPQDPRQRYSIVTARELARRHAGASIYYDALALTCPTCGSPQPTVPSDGLCPQCRAPLLPVLIHERRPHPKGHLARADVEELIHLSAGHPGILSHRAIIQYQDSVYTVVEHPGRWGMLARRQRAWSADEALAGAVQVGQALAYLHSHGFAYAEANSTGIENLIVVGGGGSVKMADLGICARLPPDDTQALQARMNSDVVFLARLLFYLATGSELSHADIEFMPPALRPFVERALGEEYAAVQDMLTDFSRLPSAPSPARSLKPSHGQATHPGRQYTRNEDAVVTFTFDKEQEGRSVPVGFYLVADGMGGHDAGDLASRTVNQIVTHWIIETKVLPDLRKVTRKLTTEDVPGELLTQAIQQANETLLRHGQAKGSDLGSTVTAALIIGEAATIANVGDSRTYLLREGRLEQVTQDHSLVARLVDAGIIRPEGVRTHPQRNQIYRCLGHKPDVDVDVFVRQLRAGDTLVLCSDGLWEMVPDAEIQRIVENARSPQRACDALVEAANRAGGEDNVAVIVVRME